MGSPGTAVGSPGTPWGNDHVLMLTSMWFKHPSNVFGLLILCGLN